MIPHILKNFNAFVNGTGFAGLCDEATLPEIKIKMDEHRAGGMDASYEIDMGMEAMSAKLNMGEYAADIIKALGAGSRIQLRGSLVRDSDGDRIAVSVEIGGRFKSFMPGNWKAGDKANGEFEMTVDYYRWTQAGEDLIEIDVQNMVRTIGGVDQLAGIRDDIGI